MLNRARFLAAVTLLVGCLAGTQARAQATNLEAGKSPSQLFAGTCNACHKSPRGLLKTVAPGSLSGFLREHYTTSGDMASQLATYVISNGASDRSKQGADKTGQSGNDQADRPGRKNRNSPAQEASRPDDAPPPAEGARPSRRRPANPGEQPEEARPLATAPPGQAAIERTPDGRKLSSKQRSKPGKQPGTDEPSMANEPAKGEPGTDDRAKAEPRQEMGNAGSAPVVTSKPADEVKSEPARIETPMVRPNPPPVVAPAPPAAASIPVPAAVSTSTPAVASGAPTEPVATPRPPVPSAPEPSAVTASAPPAPVPQSSPGGLPAPPISQ